MDQHPRFLRRQGRTPKTDEGRVYGGLVRAVSPIGSVTDPKQCDTAERQEGAGGSTYWGPPCCSGYSMVKVPSLLTNNGTCSRGTAVAHMATTVWNRTLSCLHILSSTALAASRESLFVCVCTSYVLSGSLLGSEKTLVWPLLWSEWGSIRFTEVRQE